MLGKVTILTAAAVFAIAGAGSALADGPNWTPEKKDAVFAARGWDAEKIEEVGIARCSDAGPGNYGEYPEYPDVLTVVCQVDDNNGEEDPADPGASAEHNHAPAFPPDQAP